MKPNLPGPIGDDIVGFSSLSMSIPSAIFDVTKEAPSVGDDGKEERRLPSFLLFLHVYQFPPVESQSTLAPAGD